MTPTEGLTTQEALKRLAENGPNTLKSPKKGKGLLLFLSQFKSPLVLLLLSAAILSFFLGGHTDSLIIFTILFLSGTLSFFQEKGAINALEQLLQLVESKVAVLRDTEKKKIPISEIVPGDLLLLRAGDLIPADCQLLESRMFFVDEAMFTGESCPVEKHQNSNNQLFLGTVVSSGFAKAVVTATGRSTRYSGIIEHIRFRPPETAFEVGVKKFGFFLLEVTMFLVIAVFAFNIYFDKPVLDSFLFSLAIAIGLTPQLLPAIITVNLSHGARRMAKKHVVIKRLASIENFGQMNILCVDKTGTITEGKIHLVSTVDPFGNKSDKVELFTLINAKFQEGYTNPLDQAVITSLHHDLSAWKKLSEIPYDFVRKRLSIFCAQGEKKLLISKGAFPQILQLCINIELPDGKTELLKPHLKDIENYLKKASTEGLRTLALAYGDHEKEEALTLLGFIHFSDPIKPGITQVVSDLNKYGVELKIITGDQQLIAVHAAEALGISHLSAITGPDLQKLSDHALLRTVIEHNVFAEIEPNQKEKIILSLRASGYVVGFLGDGVNDVSALHSADVSIAVNSGAGPAKEAADIVLLRKDLSILRDGMQEGRRTFINTLKYVYMATSANFGNMFSMAGVSIFLNFLPLLPKQILLTNFFSDLPEMALAFDNVDKETTQRPVKWDLNLIRKFMIVFGLLNSSADYLTFGVLLWVFKADPQLFRSGWFIENIVTAALTVLVIRTRRALFRSTPGRWLIFSVLTVAVGIFFLPFTPLGKLFEIVILPLPYYGAILGITLIYLIAIETAKKIFFRPRGGTP